MDVGRSCRPGPRRSLLQKTIGPRRPVEPSVRPNSRWLVSRTCTRLGVQELAIAFPLPPVHGARLLRRREDGPRRCARGPCNSRRAQPRLLSVTSLRCIRGPLTGLIRRLGRGCHWLCGINVPRGADTDGSLVRFFLTANPSRSAMRLSARRTPRVFRPRVQPSKNCELASSASRICPD